MKLSIRNWILMIKIESGDLIEPGVIYNGNPIVIKKKVPLKLMRFLKPDYKK